MPYYPPLYMPEPPEEDRGFRGRLKRWFSVRLSDEERHLLHQIAVRGPIPPEVWGDDPDRETLAREVATIIAEVFQWPNGNFIPEDPVKWVTYIIGWDDLEFTELLIRIEDVLGFPFDYADFEEIERGTFGEFIDYLLARCPEYRKALALSRPCTFDGETALENRPCPKLLVFLDLRAFMRQTRFKNSSNAIRLETSIRRPPGSLTQFDLHQFICTRFGLRTSPLAFDRGADEIMLGLTATILSTVPFAILCLYATVTSPADTDLSMWFIPLGIAALGLGITALFAIPHAFRAILNLNRETRTRRIRTLRDLVTWIVEERDQVSRDMAQGIKRSGLDIVG